MPRKNGRKSNGSGADSCLIPFHFCFNQALVAGVGGSGFTPAIFPRLAVEADAWAHFRVKRLSFRLHPTSPKTAAQAACFIGGLQDTPPGTFSAVSEVLSSCINAVGSTVPSEWVHVQKSELAGPFPWYKSVAGTADSTEEQPGSFQVVGTGTEIFTLEFRGIFEFKTAVATVNTPVALFARKQLHQERVNAELAMSRATLLKILNSTTTSP